MTDYISREAALKAANAFWYAPDVPKAIEDIPAADVVEVVRCKDCKWYREGGQYSYCIIARGNHPNQDDFCSYGERQDA